MIDYENLGEANHHLFDEYRDAFNRVLESGWYILGAAVKRFENEFALYNGNYFCAGVANGLDALILALSSKSCNEMGVIFLMAAFCKYS